MTEEILESCVIKNVEIGKMYAFIDAGKVFLLSEKGTSIFIDNALYETIKSKNCPEELLIKLVQRGFAQFGCSPAVVEKKAKIYPNFFMITMTNNCNMRCKYCFHQFLPEHLSVLQEDMLEKILDYIIKYAKQNHVPRIMIQAWGGEPLLCMNLLEKMFHKLEASGITYKICLETNGTLLTEKVVEKLNEMRIGVGISMDGIAEIQNEQRPFANGTDSFEALCSGVRRMQKNYHDRFGSITVVTKDVLEHLEECLDYFAEMNISTIKFNIARVSEQQTFGLNQEEVEDFAVRLVDRMVYLTEQGHHITEGNMVDRLKNLLKRNDQNICNSHGCQGGKRMISFDTLGNIYPCEMTDYPEECLGNIETDHDLVSLIQSRQGKGYYTEKNLGNCKDCPFLYYCGGGCTTAIIYQKGRVEGIDELGCTFNKAIYRRLIYLLLHKPQVAEQIIEERL
ncbi:MAG: radical SAM protein [bacterium]|nr:radical SAM protein [bacterium]